MSPAMRIGRRRSRSTQTPAGRLNRMNGRNSIVVSRPNSKGVTSRVVAAMSGRASCVIELPNTEIVSAVQSLRKSGWRRRLRLGVCMDGRVYGGRPAARIGRMTHARSVAPVRCAARRTIRDTGRRSWSPRDPLRAPWRRPPQTSLAKRPARAPHGRMVRRAAGNRRRAGNTRPLMQPGADSSGRGSVRSGRARRKRAQRLRRPAPRGDRAARGRPHVGARRVPPRPDVRSQPQPLGVHGRRRA